MKSSTNKVLQAIMRRNRKLFKRSRRNNKKGKTMSKGWSVGKVPEKCTNCDFQKDEKWVIQIQAPVMQVIFGMCDKVVTEWQMLLLGEIDTDKRTVYVTDYWVPKQKVTYASVINEDLIDAEVIAEKGIVAGIHSHSNMGVFFSSTDDEFSNMSLIKHHVVVNNKYEFIATSRVDLPCGMVKFMDTAVITGITPSLSIIGIENVQQEVRHVTNGNHGGSYQHNWHDIEKERKDYWNKFATPKNKAIKLLNLKDDEKDDPAYSEGWVLDPISGLLVKRHTLSMKEQEGAYPVTNEEAKDIAEAEQIANQSNPNYYTGMDY